MAGRVAGKVAFITGAARGQGRSHAVRLAEEGADIIAIDTLKTIATADYPMASADDMAETVRLVEATGRRIHFAHADVRDFDSLKAALDDGVGKFGRVDIVSANAGILSFGSGHEMSEDTWGEMIDINLSGVWRTAKAAIPHLIGQGEGGSIILTSSLAGLQANAGIGHYVSAKHGVVGLMKTLAVELAEHNIRVNAVNPSQVDTPMVQHQGMYDLFNPHLEHPTKEDFARASGDTIALPIPWIESIDISNAVLFLASDESRYVTGLPVTVDAGSMLK